MPSHLPVSFPPDAMRLLRFRGLAELRLLCQPSDARGGRLAPLLSLPSSGKIVGISPAGLAPGQIYTYPARCWRKRRRLNILEDPRLRPCEFKIGKKLGGEGGGESCPGRALSAAPWQIMAAGILEASEWRKMPVANQNRPDSGCG